MACISDFLPAKETKQVSIIVTFDLNFNWIVTFDLDIRQCFKINHTMLHLYLLLRAQYPFVQEDGYNISRKCVKTM